MSCRIGNDGLRALCQSCGARLTDLAEVLRCDRTSIFRYLAGRRSPKLERRMARTFGLSVPTLRRALSLEERGHA